MNRLSSLRLSACLALGLAGSPAVLAQSTDEAEIDRIGAAPTPELGGTDKGPIGSAEFQALYKSYEGRPLDPMTYIGAEWLDMDPEFVQGCRTGVHLVYLRQYNKARAHFQALGKAFPNSAVAEVIEVLVWQALMLENFDFKYENQYQLASKKSKQKLQEAMLVSGNDAWEYFLLAGLLGIDSIHAMRHDDFVVALNRGYEAMKAVKKVKTLAPNFKDMLLGDGLFNYWVSVISMSSKLIPDTGDNRKLGISQMMTVEEQGVFLGPPATLGLTFTWIEEGKKDKALASALKAHASYPDNVVNNLVLGRIYMYSKKYADADRIYDQVLAASPKNQRVHYYKARLYLRWNKLPQAKTAFDNYLAFTDIGTEERAWALYYKGSLMYRQKNYAEAENLYKQAWKLGKIKRAQSKLKHIQEKHKG